MATRWYPLTITQTQTPTGYIIVLTTNTPCNLALLWTDKQPWTHRISTLKRGINLPWNAYWCFVTWHIILQQEPGDTYVHTFIWNGWVNCQTKYFRFFGTIAGVTSESDSPIFKKHFLYTGPPPSTLHDYYNLGDDFGLNYSNVWYNAQQITIAASFTCTSAKLKLGATGGLGGGALMVAGIRALDPAGHPTGALLCSKSRPITDCPDRNWLEFTWDTPLSLTAGQKVGLQIRLDRPYLFGDMLWYDDISSPTYTGGFVVRTPTGNDADFYDRPGEDLMFELWGY